MSGTVVMAPLIDSSDSSRYCPKRASQSCHCMAMVMARSFPGPHAGNAAHRQQHPAQRHLEHRDGQEHQRHDGQAGGEAQRMLAQLRHQLDAGGGDEPARHRAHAAQRSRHLRVAGVVRVEHGQREDDEQRNRQHARHGRQRAAQAEVAVADHQGEVDHVGARHDLGHGPVLEELLGREPLLLLDHLALHDGQHPAEALQRQPGERHEKVARRLRVRGSGRGSRCGGWGRRVHVERLS
jgi:hypothetical protein